MSDEFTRVMSTADVAVEADVSEVEAADWARDNGVQRVGSAFAWTPLDVSDFLADLAEDEDEDEDEDDDEDEEG